MSQKIFDWLDEKVREGKGTVEIGLTENGDIGIWTGGVGTEGQEFDGVGDTVEEALNSAIPDDQDLLPLNGVWKVTVLGDPNLLNYAQDHKVIQWGLGYNLVGDHKWGWFKVEKEEQGKGFILNYDDSRNPETLRKIRDLIFKDGDGWKGSLSWGGKTFFCFRLDPATLSGIENPKEKEGV